MHWQEDVSSMFTARSALNQPAQLDEEPVRVGVLLLRAAELFRALGGLLVAQVHATQESLHASTSSQSSTMPLIVTALEHGTSDTRMLCSLSRVMSADDSRLFLRREFSG